VWYDTLRFTIHTPELAMVRFVVEDYDKTSKNDFVGQYTLPFCCVQQGEPNVGNTELLCSLSMTSSCSRPDLRDSSHVTIALGL